MTASGQRTTERVAEAIRDGICAGRFVPGQHLVEIDLTQRLGISRSSLREALHQLHGDGIVTMHRYRGTHICRLSRKAAMDLLDVLEALVCLAADRAAAGTGDREMILEAATNVARIHAASPGQQNIIGPRQAFYDALFAASDNAELPRATPLRRADLFRAQIRAYQSNSDQSSHIAGYAGIAKAVIAGDRRAAQQAVAAHFQTTRAMVEGLPDAAFGDA